MDIKNLVTMDIKNLVKTKSFYTGIGGIIAGLGLIFAGEGASFEIGIAMIWGGLQSIFFRDSQLKSQ